MMANAGRDPLFWAALDVANHDLPGIGEWCLRCHSPGGWLEGRATPPTGSADGCSLSGEIDGTDNDFEGLHCAFCHRMQINPSPPAGQQSVYYENGQYWIDDTSCTMGFEPCRKGPYDYTMGQPHPPHGWESSQYHRDSDICGNCHNVTNPLLNNCVSLDNRIPPAGFTGMNDIETRPVNYTYPETSPGSGILVNFDDTSYTVPIPVSATGDLMVEATIQYQTTSDDYVEFLLDQAVTHGFPDDCIPRSTGLPDMSRAEILHSMWTSYDRAPPVPMATASVTVTVGLFADGFESGGTSAWSSTAP